jgi:acetolactate synthase I/II/III large subunit
MLREALAGLKCPLADRIQNDVVSLLNKSCSLEHRALRQAENYGGRVVGTTLKNSDYAGMARALGAYGERVETPSNLTEALRRALDNAPAVLDVVTSQLAVSSDAKKGLGYIPDYQPLTAWKSFPNRAR